MALRLVKAGAGEEVLTHIFGHEGAVPVARVVGASRFVGRSGSGPAGIEMIARDFEDPWRRGMHDAGLVAAMILDLVRKGVRQAK